MSEFAVLDSSHIAAGGLVLGLVLYILLRNRVRRDHIEMQRRIDPSHTGDPAATGNYDLRTKTRGSRSWIS